MTESDERGKPRKGLPGVMSKKEDSSPPDGLSSKWQAYLYNALWFHRLATRAHSRAVQINDPAKGDSVDDCLTAIIYSALATEAAINELTALAVEPFFDDGRTRPSIGALGSALAEVEVHRGSTQLKYQVAFIVLKGEALARDRRPFQDLVLLFELRDALVHLKLDKRQGESQQALIADVPKLLEKLRSRGAIVPTTPKTLESPEAIRSWPRLVATPALAKWACETPALLVDELLKALPDCSFKSDVDRFIAEPIKRNLMNEDKSPGKQE